MESMSVDEAEERWCPYLDCWCKGPRCMAWRWDRSVRGGEPMPEDVGEDGRRVIDQAAVLEWLGRPLTQGWCERLRVSC